MSNNVGDAVPLVYTISQAATVTLTVTDPDGAISTPPLTQGGSPPAVTYTAAVLVSKPGLWLYRFAATGAVTDAEDGAFHVAAPVAANLYSTVQELKASFQTMPPSDTADDGDLADAILAASRAIDQECQRHFYQIVEARTAVPCDLWTVKLGAFHDLVEVASLKTDASGDGTFETTWAPGDFQLLTADDTPNVAAGPEPRPYAKVRAVGSKTFPIPYGAWVAQRRDRVEITGTWGWPQIPAAVRRACRLLAAQQFKLREAPFGVAGFGDLGLIRVRDHPEAMRLLAPYRRYPALVA